MNKNVLVTSCGGDIGQSIGKILKRLNCTTFGLDISNQNAAQFVFDSFEVGLRVSNKDYLTWLEQYVSKNQIDFIIPASEPELKFYTKNYTDNVSINGAKVIMANHLSRTIGFSKQKTADFLQQQELPYPKSYTLDSPSISYPLIAKPIDGAGSANVFTVRDEADFRFFAERYEGLIFQEFLDGSSGEFTCGVFRTKNHPTRTITFRRTLTVGGYSGFGEVVYDKRIDDLLQNVAKHLNLEGSINAQLRIHNDRPVIFEINPRFSSTVLFRDMLGYCDLQWSLEAAIGEAISDYDPVPEGRKFYKGFNEFIS